jgi:4-amino-4-deoxy-L-arabinose transferase-like glycosyltransferase
MINRYGIFIILLLAFSLRIYSIQAPLIGIHSWRQTDTASIARNYYENGYRFSYPQIDWGGDTPGYVECEFPLYPFVVALGYKLFGVHESLGRLFSVFCALTALYFFYRLIKQVGDYRTAFWSSLMLAGLPLNIFFSRAFMPESLLLMSSIIGITFFSQWLDSRRGIHFFISLFFMALAALVKIPTLYLGLPLLYLSWSRYGRKLWNQWPLGLYGLVIFLAVGGWYYHAHGIYLKTGYTFGIWGYGTDKWGNWDLVFSGKYWNALLFQSLAEKHLTWVGVPLFVSGWFIRPWKKEERLFIWWMAALLVYFVIVAQGNYAHDYYQLPFILPAAFFMGKSLSCFVEHSRSSKIKQGLLILWVLAFFLVGLGRYGSLIKEEDSEKSTDLKLARQIQEKVPAGDRIIVVDGGNPTILYLAHKKGWHANPIHMVSPFIKDRVRLGAKYLVGPRAPFNNQTIRGLLEQLMVQYPVVVDNRDFFILKISSPEPG